MPGAIFTDQSVLQSRLDPASAHSRREVASHDQRIILVCNEGYGSGLAAAPSRAAELGPVIDANYCGVMLRLPVR